MISEESRKKRIVFNWHDGIAIVATLIILIIILLVSLFGLPTVDVNEATLEIRYENKIVLNNFKVVDSSSSAVTYALSFRRELKTNESYDDNIELLSKYGLTEETQSIDSLRKYDFNLKINEIKNKYIIVKDDALAFNGFKSFIGPQIDILVNNKGFQIEKENSPKNYCSKQGFENRVNWPVVCLPNSFSTVLSNPNYFGNIDGQV